MFPFAWSQLGVGGGGKALIKLQITCYFAFTASTTLLYYSSIAIFCIKALWMLIAQCYDDFKTIQYNVPLYIGIPLVFLYNRLNCLMKVLLHVKPNNGFF